MPEKLPALLLKFSRVKTLKKLNRPESIWGLVWTVITAGLSIYINLFSMRARQPHSQMGVRAMTPTRREALV